MSAKVIQLFKKKQKNWIEAASYSSLIQEQNYLRSEMKKVRRAINAVDKIDANRGMILPETAEIQVKLDDIYDGYKFILEQVQKEMINRMRNGL